MPLPSSTATLASASFWFIVRGVARHDDQGQLHGVLGESIRHAGGAALHLATDLDEHRAELAKLAVMAASRARSSLTREGCWVQSSDLLSGWP